MGTYKEWGIIHKDKEPIVKMKRIAAGHYMSECKTYMIANFLSWWWAYEVDNGDSKNAWKPIKCEAYSTLKKAKEIVENFAQNNKINSTTNS